MSIFIHLEINHTIKHTPQEQGSVIENTVNANVRSHQANEVTRKSASKTTVKYKQPFIFYFPFLKCFTF